MKDQNDHPNYVKGRIFSIRNAINGWLHVLKEKNAIIHFIATVATFIGGILLEFNFIEWCILILVISSVWVMEALNTAIEKLVDLVSPEYNEKAGIIKDISAGAVFAASKGAILIGLVLFGRYFI